MFVMERELEAEEKGQMVRQLKFDFERVPDSVRDKEMRIRERRKKARAQRRRGERLDTFMGPN